MHKQFIASTNIKITLIPTPTRSLPGAWRLRRGLRGSPAGLRCRCGGLLCRGGRRGGGPIRRSWREGDCFAVGAHVADYADAADGQQRAEGLPDIVVEARFADFFDEYRVGFAEHVEAFFFELAEAADGEAGAGERMALKEVRSDAQDFSDAAHFVFEEVAQRLEQPHLHVVWQAADVVVAFDYSAAAVSAFDYVGVYRPLEQPVGAAETARLFLKYADEELAYYLALAFRLGHSREGGEEAFARVYVMHVEVERAVGLHDLFALVLAQHSVVYEYAVQLVADGALRDYRGDCGVYAAGESADDRSVADLLAYLFYFMVYPFGAERPFGFAAADVEEEG